MIKLSLIVVHYGMNRSCYIVKMADIVVIHLLELDRYRISVSIHSLHWRIGEYDISVCVSPPIPSVIIISSNLTRRVKQADGSH